MTGIRSATGDDAPGMARVQAEIVAARGAGPQGDTAWTRARYIDHAARIGCFVAIAPGGRLLGFQSLKCAWDGNPYEVAPGWGLIGTHIAPTAARRGVGRGLFTATLAAATQAGLSVIDTTIGATNAGGLAYYDAMGFVTYAGTEAMIRKRFDLDTMRA